MKIKITVYFFMALNFLTVLTITQTNAQGWVKTYDKNNFHYVSVYFIDNNTGFIAGISKSLDKSVLIRTTNNGVDWDIVYSSLKLIHNIYFLNNLTGFAAGADGLLLKTMNCGNHWENVDANITGSILSVLFIDDKNGFTGGSDESGGSGYIYYTDNGGDTWTNATPGGTNGIGSICFINETTGFACGTGKILKKTVDGGRSWTFASLPLFLPASEYNLVCIKFINQKTGFIVGGYMNAKGLILSTTDSGDNWVKKDMDNAMNSLFFVNENTGYAAGANGFITKTTDGGSTWNTEETGCSDILYSIYFVNSDTGFAVGQNGVLLKTTTGGNE